MISDVAKIANEPAPAPAPALDATVNELEAVVELGRLVSAANELKDVVKFNRLVGTANELTVDKVNNQIGRMVSARILPDKANWQTPKRHLIADAVLKQCKDPTVLRTHWPMIRFLRGASLGNPVAEIRILVSMMVWESLVDELDAVSVDELDAVSE